MLCGKHTLCMKALKTLRYERCRLNHNPLFLAPDDIYPMAGSRFPNQTLTSVPPLQALAKPEKEERNFLVGKFLEHFKESYTWISLATVCVKVEYGALNVKKGRHMGKDS